MERGLQFLCTCKYFHPFIESRREGRSDFFCMNSGRFRKCVHVSDHISSISSLNVSLMSSELHVLLSITSVLKAEIVGNCSNVMTQESKNYA